MSQDVVCASENVVVNLDETVAPEAPKKRSTIATHAFNVGNFIYFHFKEQEELGEDLKMVWKTLIALLMLFDVQLFIKYKVETSKTGVKRHVFFFSNGKPKEMSSFRLVEKYSSLFLKLPMDYRALIGHTYEEHKHMFHTFSFPDEPLSLDSFFDEKTRADALVLAKEFVHRWEDGSLIGESSKSALRVAQVKQ